MLFGGADLLFPCSFAHIRCLIQFQIHVQVCVYIYIYIYVDQRFLAWRVPSSLAPSSLLNCAQSSHFVSLSLSPLLAWYGLLLFALFVLHVQQ